MRLFSRWLAMLLLGGNLTNRAVAEDPAVTSSAAAAASDGEEKQNLESALAMTRAAAVKYEFELRGVDEPPVLREQPILRWSNPERGQIFGNVFLWTHRGRPEVVGSLYKWFSPFTHMAHEFHSLSRGELVGKYESTQVWRSAQPGVLFAAVPDAPEVAATPAGRLSQMRQLARQFTARSLDREGLKSELRLLAQPVYRYEVEKESTDLVDGALFVFVEGTDPDVWLLLEAVPGAGQASSRWQFAAARMNSFALTVEHKGQAIWNCDIMPFSEVGAHKSAYTSFQFKQP